MLFSEAASGSINHTCLVERKPWITRMKPRLYTIAKVADKIYLPAAIREKFGIDFLGVEARHGSAIQPQSAGGDDHIGALHWDVTRDQILRCCFAIFKQSFEITLWIQLRHQFEKTRVASNYYRHRGRFHLVNIARVHARQQTRLCLLRDRKHKPRRAAIG